MEKYKDLIVTLIKNHRRYPGCESILNEIAEEVCEKAKTVVTSVDDETIITKYLTKLVSTAMITVPKKYNISPTIKKQRLVESEVAPIINTPIIITKNTVDSSLDNNKLEENIEPVELNTNTEEDIDLLDEIAQDETNLATIEQNSIVDIEDDNKESDVNIELVDKMINGVGENSKTEKIEINALESTEDLEELDISQDNNELDMIEETQDIDIEDIDKSNNRKEELEESFDINTDDITEYTDEPELDIESADIQEQDFNIYQEQENEEELDEIDSIFEEEEEENLSDLEENSIEQTETSSIQTEDVIFEFNLPDLSCFNFEQSKEEIDTDNVYDEIKEYASKNSGIPVMDVWNLKYCKHASIDEIATELNITKNDVVNILNNLANLVEG